MICIAEDRKAEGVGVRLLIRSLARWCPDQPVLLWHPCADSAFVAWLARFPRVRLMPGRLEGAAGWDIKPHALRQALKFGAAEAWWIDSDVLVTKNFIADYRRIPSDRFIVAEEALYGSPDIDGARARAWGFEVRRPLPFCLNSAVMRATSSHLPLLDEWIAHLDSAVYRDAQSAPPAERPAHLLGDQDVLTACLAGPLADVPLHFLRRGKDIIQYFGPAGYMPLERMRHWIFGLPAFVHSMGADKPWRTLHRSAGFQGQFNLLYAELSPYKHVAQPFKEEYEGSPWTTHNRLSRTGRWLGLLGLGSAPLTGLPLAVLYSGLRLTKRVTARLAKGKSGS